MILFDPQKQTEAKFSYYKDQAFLKKVSRIDNFQQLAFQLEDST